MKRILTALILPAVLASPAWSDFTSFGAGNTTCGQFVELNDERGKLSTAEQWMWGFFSGFNYSVQTQQNKDSHVGKGKHYAIYAAVLKHCKDKPLDDIFDATEKVLMQLR